MSIPPADYAGWPEARRNAWWADQNRAIHGEKNRGGKSPAFKLSLPAARADGRPAPTDRRAFTPAYASGLVILTAADLLKREFPPQEMMLTPWMPEKGLAMTFAERGIGKTHLAMNIAYAVASGGAFLRWQAPRARRVVYIDGEMPGLTLKERLAMIVAHASVEAPDDYLSFVAADMQPDGLPDLASPDAQRFYDASIKDADLIVVDNLSTICRGLRENEADSWGPVRIPIQSGRCFRFQAGRVSDLMPATIPK